MEKSIGRDDRQRSTEVIDFKIKEGRVEHADVFRKKAFKDDAVNQVTNIKTDNLVQVTYYFKPGQVIAYHRHPGGDQIFFVHEGEGTCYTEGNKEEAEELRPGVIVLAPKGVWHKIAARTELIVSAATTNPAGFEKR